WFSVGEPDMASALANYDEHEEAYREFSAYNHVSADDPPLFLTYFEALTLPSTRGGHGIHHPVLGLKMKEKYEEVGAKCHLVVSDRYDAGTEFLLDVLLK
ncbi:MAG: alpha/beta hydrolase, partial [Verrucomicrobiota bacterium]